MSSVPFIKNNNFCLITSTRIRLQSPTGNISKCSISQIKFSWIIDQGLGNGKCKFFPIKKGKTELDKNEEKSLYTETKNK